MNPIVKCALCHRQMEVDPFVRGFPPDVARRKLIKACDESGCPCDPQYRAGIG